MPKVQAKSNVYCSGSKKLYKAGEEYDESEVAHLDQDDFEPCQGKPEKKDEKKEEKKK